MNARSTLRPLCGRRGRRGPCRMPLSHDGKCPVHDSTDLAARNSAVALSFREKRPDAFRAQRSTAGKCGQAKTGEAQWAYATEMARQWRIEHPSEPEQLLGSVLSDFDILVHMEREHVIAGDPRAVDVAFPFQKCCIECTGSAARASFGRNDKREAKRAWLESLGWNIHYFYYDADFDTEVRRLGDFLAAHQLIV